MIHTLEFPSDCDPEYTMGQGMQSPIKSLNGELYFKGDAYVVKKEFVNNSATTQCHVRYDVEIFTKPAFN